MAAFALLVFVAGLISFLSPCVLPLVPGYVSMLTGVGVDQLKEGQGSTGKLFSSALSFVFGFSVVFITMGATASAVGSFLLRNRNLLAPIAGALIILFGLHLIGWLIKIPVRVGVIAGVVIVAFGVLLHFHASATSVVRPVHFYAAALIFLFGPSLTRWLNRDVHMNNVGGNQPGMLSGFLLGFAFALGWTPCIGPILTTVLAIAAMRDKVTEGVMLLTLYSLGLAIPFLLTAVGIGRFMKFYKKFRRYLHAVEVFSGVLLLAIGCLIFVNGLTRMSSMFAKLQPENVLGLIKGGKPPIDVESTPSQANLNPEPDVTFKNLQGQDIALSSYKGKVVLLNFWGTWCEPCQHEIPLLIDMQNKYSSKGFTLLGAATNDENPTVDKFIHTTQFNVGGQELMMNYPIVMGSDDISTKFGGLLGMPTSFLITRDGKIYKRYIGGLDQIQAQVTKDIESQL
jgi:cytochrome c-type biogenesis protein